MKIVMFFNDSLHILCYRYILKQYEDITKVAFLPELTTDEDKRSQYIIAVAFKRKLTYTLLTTPAGLEACIANVGETYLLFTFFLSILVY